VVDEKIIEVSGDREMFCPLSPEEQKYVDQASEGERRDFLASIPSYERLARNLAADGHIDLAMRARHGEFVLDMGALLAAVDETWRWRIKSGEFKPTLRERDAAYARFVED